MSNHTLLPSENDVKNRNNLAKNKSSEAARKKSRESLDSFVSHLLNKKLRVEKYIELLNDFKEVPFEQILKYINANSSQNIPNAFQDRFKSYQKHIKQYLVEIDREINEIKNKSTEYLEGTINDRGEDTNAVNRYVENMVAQNEEYLTAIQNVMLNLRWYYVRYKLQKHQESIQKEKEIFSFRISHLNDFDINFIQYISDKENKKNVNDPGADKTQKLSTPLPNPQERQVHVDEDVYTIGFKHGRIRDIKNIENEFNSCLVTLNGFIHEARIYREEAKYIICNAIPANQTSTASSLKENFAKYANNCLVKIIYWHLLKEYIWHKLNLIDQSLQQLQLDETNTDTAKAIFASVKDEYDRFFMNGGQLLEAENKPITFRTFLRERRDSNSLEKLFDSVLENQVFLTVIGRRGAGKSSFINSIRNLNPFDEANTQLAKVDEVECTKSIKFYNYETRQPPQESQDASSSKATSNRVFICDLPGVGTENFPNLNFANLESDLFIYIFYPRLDERDLKIIKSIDASSTRQRLLIVRNKVDVDFGDVCANVDDIDDAESLRKAVEASWPSMRDSLLSYFLQNYGDSDSLEAYFKPETKRFYFLSSNYSFRKYFEFEEFVEDLCTRHITSEKKAKTLFASFKENFMNLRKYEVGGLAKGIFGRFFSSNTTTTTM